MIDLYSWPAPTGHKVHILVEELAIPYRLLPVDIRRGEQHEAGYRSINPNGKIPAIVDHAPRDGGAPVTVFETGAILLYLAEKEKRYLPVELRSRSDVLQWLFWQVGGLGPMMGQAQHFLRYAPEPVPYGIHRYQAETRRLLQIMDARLDGCAALTLTWPRSRHVRWRIARASALTGGPASRTSAPPMGARSSNARVATWPG